MTPTFYKLLFLQAATRSCNAVLRFALLLYLLRHTSSTSLYGFVTAIALLPMLAGTAIGGILADHLRKQDFLAGIEWITALCAAAASILQQVLPVSAFVLLALCVLYAAEGASQPAIQSSLPLFLQGAALARGNAAFQLVNTFSEILGSFIGSFLLGRLGISGMLFCSVPVFLLTAWREKQLLLSDRRPDRRNGPKACRCHGIALLRQYPQLFRLALLLALLNLAVVPAFTVGVPVLVIHHFALSDTALALAQSAMNLGGLLGSILAGILANRISLRQGAVPLWSLTALCALLGAAVLPCVPVEFGYAATACLALLMMAAASLFQILLTTFLQAHIPADCAGSFMGTVTIAACLTQPVGQVVFGLAYDIFALQPYIMPVISAIVSVFLNLYAMHIFKGFAFLTKK